MCTLDIFIQINLLINITFKSNFRIISLFVEQVSLFSKGQFYLHSPASYVIISFKIVIISFKIVIISFKIVIISFVIM